MRIVAGKHGSRSLKTLKGQTTRPTTDKIRGAIFNHVGPFFESGNFLDVFGGSGAVGLEALSRGMDHATFIEKDRKAKQIIVENSEILLETEKVEIIVGDCLRVLPSLAKTYDIVFMDPPYAFPKITQTLQTIVNDVKLSPHTIIIVETDAHTDLPETVGEYHCYHAKDYGTTIIRYYRNQLEI